MTGTYRIDCPECSWQSREFEELSGEITAKVDAEMHYVDNHDGKIPDDASFGNEQCPECLDIDGFNGTVSCKNCGFVPEEHRVPMTDGGQPADGIDHIYVVELPGFWRWTADYSIAFEMATGMRLDEWDGEDEHPEEDRITIMHTRRHTYVLDLSRDEEVIEKQMACLNTDYDCGHVAYGPPNKLPPECPECEVPFP